MYTQYRCVDFWRRQCLLAADTFRNRRLLAFVGGREVAPGLEAVLGALFDKPP